MKLRELDEYSIGFDLGTGSVGWAVITPDGELPRWKGRPVWGSRVFPTAATAADTRLKRGQRRRYVRRRWRLNILQELFLDEIKKVDAGFFDRLNQSRLLPSDRGFHSPLFNGSDLSEKEYYKRFPTMSHLRAWLMNTDGKADIRLVYLAFHNIVKHRGNFLQQDNKRLSARTVNIDDAINRLAEELALRGESIECAVAVDVPAAAGAFKEGERKRAAIASGVQESIRIEASEFKSTARVLGRALVGYKVDFSKMLMLEGVGLGSASLSDDDKVEEILSAVPDDCLPLFNAIYEVYSAYILMGILRLSEGELQTGSVAGMDGQTLSFCQVREYEKYGKDLATLKSLVNAYAPREYDSFFRGELYPGTRLYNKQTAKGYTRYNAVHKTDYENFAKDVAKLFEGTGAQEDERYRDMMQEFEERRFLRRQKTGDNGSIPYQLHLEEMNAIIENQGRHHPFLLDVRDKLTSLVTFRIPYYVGPLAKANAALDAKGSRRFSWAERLPGKEHEPIRPWNWDQVIDKNRAAHDFIMRMTNDCTYLFDEPVLPRCSLLYEEFCVLNELNGAWFVEDGDTKRRFNSFDDRYGIVEELFKNKRKVKFTDVANWLQRNGSAGPHVRVGGGQGEAGFESSLTSYRFFCKDVFHVDELDEAWVPMIEDIILWNTLFEDRKILKEELERNYGDRLTPEQIKTICKKRFTGWGKLSKKFLQGLKAKTDNGPKSIMDVLREGGQMASGRMRAMVLMEVLHDDGLGFQELIERENLSKLPATGELQVEDLPGSPSVRRTVNQAMRILDEITRIVGKPPVNVFVEVTRDEGDKRRTTRRYDQVKKAVMALGTEYGELKRELKDREPKAFDDERLMLYFLQGGKCLYSGTALDINLLSEYEVDHIIPQAYIKDDSLENKALVLSKYNQAKTDHLLISPAIRQSQCVRWAELRRAGMMGEKKYNNLMRSEISDKKMKGFIARQLVETSQSIKLFQMMIQNHYPDCRIVPVRARLSSELREVKDYFKCREINDFHHAHDALIAAQLGRFLLYRHGEIFENRVGYEQKVKAYIRKVGAEERSQGKKVGTTSFFIASFLKSGFDRETGEVFRENDRWDATFECERIRAYLNDKQVLLTRMPEVNHGAFWDQTVYSPRDTGKNLSIPLKSGLEVDKYGGFSREQFAYFYCYEAKDGRGRRSIQFAEISVQQAASQHIDIEEVARLHAASIESRDAPFTFVRVLRAKIPKQQVIEIGGSRVLLRGKNEVRCATPLAFNQKDTELLLNLLGGELVDQDEKERVDGLFMGILSSIEKRCGLLAGKLKLGDRMPAFSGLDMSEKALVLKGLIALMAAKSNMEDMRPIGGARLSGCMQLNIASAMLKPHNFAFIDQSVTGLFEERTFIDEL